MDWSAFNPAADCAAVGRCDTTACDEATAALVDTLCRPDGWDFTATIGAAVSRSLGGTGSLAASRAEGTAEISLALQFARDERFTAFPQGRTRLLRPSRYVASAPGLWSLDAVASEDDARGASAASAHACRYDRL